MKTPPDRLVNGPQGGLMVAGDDQFELGNEVEKVLAHEASCHLIATRRTLDLGFGPSPALFRLGRRYHPGTVKSGKIGRVTLTLAFGERLDRRRPMVIANDPGGSFEKLRFSIRAGTVQKEHRVL